MLCRPLESTQSAHHKLTRHTTKPESLIPSCHFLRFLLSLISHVRLPLSLLCPQHEPKPLAQIPILPLSIRVQCHTHNILKRPDHHLTTGTHHLITLYLSFRKRVPADTSLCRVPYHPAIDGSLTLRGCGVGRSHRQHISNQRYLSYATLQPDST